MLVSILIGAGVVVLLGLGVWLLSHIAYHTYHEGVPGVIIAGGALIIAVVLIGMTLMYFFGGR